MPVNCWGKFSRSEQYGTKLEFLDRNKAKFDWGNADLEEDEGLVESNPATHPGILVEILGVAIESDSEVDTALYGLLCSALLFYRKLVSKLVEMGFELNRYDPCVANRLAC